ncbi:MAG: hypothetical protein IKQ69_03525 [Oscillospiraceae bacterium]|nr:hypothetical protein [Oscillospiraceae bacterium]
MRTANSFKNLVTGLFGKALAIVLAFVVRTVFIATLSERYLGINGLLTSILELMNLAELGLGETILFAMYKPVAEHDTEKVRSLMSLFQKTYRIIATVILIVGLALIPFLYLLVPETTELVDIRIIFFISLVEKFLSYWLGVYSVVLFAEQRNYVTAILNYLASVATTIGKIVFLFLLRRTPMLSYYCYSAIGVAGNLFNLLLIRWKVRTEFPWCRDLHAPPLPPEEKKGIVRNMAGLLTKKVCRIAHESIDNLVLSVMVGLSVVGIYSNYVVLKNYVVRILSTVYSSITASLGNLCAVDSDERKENFFLSLQFSYFWIYGFCAICFWILFNPFIVGVWLHDTKWLISDVDVFLVVFNFLIQGLAEDVEKYRDVNGLYWQSKFRYIFSTVFNVVVSILLVGPAHMGLTGALLGTTASIIIMIALDPVIVYREVFHKGAGEYYLRYAQNLALILLTGALVHVLCLPLRAYTFSNFLLRFLLCLFVPNGLWYLLFRKDPRFDYFRKTALNLLRSVRRRLRRRNSGEDLS